MTSLTPYKKRGIIHVIGSWSDSHSPLSYELGKALAENGFCMMTGGNGGVAKKASEGFVGVEGRKGVTIGVLAQEMKGEMGGDIHALRKIHIY